MSTRKIFAIAFIAAISSRTAFAQPQPLQQVSAPVSLDSGIVAASEAGTRSVVYSELVQVPNATWLRLEFTQALLGATASGGQPTQLRITSLADGAVQLLDAVSVQQWGFTSAYFNGNEVKLELVADPGAAASRVRMSHVMIGLLEPSESICGDTDNRVPSDDPRVARLLPSGCTGWIIDDDNRCMLTAGHCTDNLEVVQFNVPLSGPGGALQHPGPEDQYPVDPDSLQSNGGQGVGNDWAYFGCYANSTTGLTPYETQGMFFELAAAVPTTTGQPTRITGYGVTSLPVPHEWNQIQKTHSGPFGSLVGTSLSYTTDTTGGNSGSPVIDEISGRAIGIHTHGGCASGGNHGTAIFHAALQDALNNPQGVCAPTQCTDSQPIVDQSQNGVEYGFFFAPSVPRWQEFTPTRDNIVAVDLHLNTNTAFYDSMTAAVSITEASDQVLWTGQFEYDGDWNGWVTLDMPEMTVVPGEVYRIHVIGEGGVWRGSTISTYPGYNSVDTGAAPDHWDGFDFAFRTHATCDASCPWDVDDDGLVGIHDLIQLLLQWGFCDAPGACTGDFDSSGFVGLEDLVALVVHWGACP